MKVAWMPKEKRALEMALFRVLLEKKKVSMGVDISTNIRQLVVSIGGIYE